MARVVLVLLLLLVATEMGPTIVAGAEGRSFDIPSQRFKGLTIVAEAEGKICDFPSRSFKGLCFSSDNCAAVCKTEDLTTGYCKGLLKRCICTKPCP